MIISASNLQLPIITLHTLISEVVKSQVNIRLFTYFETGNTVLHMWQFGSRQFTYR